MRGLVSFLLVPAGIYAGLCLLMFLTQRSQIYFPVRESDAPGATAVRFPVDGAELKVWTITRPGPAAILYFGGNAEDVGFNVPSFSASFPDHTIYLVNYRGYGGSTGNPTERGLVGDAIALYDQLRARHPQISVIGRSLGSGVAVELASEREVERLVLVTPFDSLVNVAGAHFPYLPVRLLMRDRYDSAGSAPSIEAKTLIVVAGMDEIIPRERTDALVAAFRPGQARVVVLEGARHNDLDRGPRYLDALRGFLAQ